MDANMIIVLVLKVVALAMGIVTIVLGFFPKEANNKTQITILGIGLTAMALAVLL
jgi:uncharacterized membrane protein HdeD (DUF308 family)